MLIVLAQEHKQHLQFLGSVGAEGSNSIQSLRSLIVTMLCLNSGTGVCTAGR